MEKHLIKQILLEQKEEIAGLFQERIVERECGRAAKEMFESDLIKVIMGVRRCGKSILAHQSLRPKEYGYVNFDDERLIGATKEDLNNFLEVLQEITPGLKYLLFDEAQNIEGWELFVNRLKRNRYAVTVTGSNAKLLSKDLATHLTGRHFGIELYPFSFKEFLSYKNITVREHDFYITGKKALINRLLDEYLVFQLEPFSFKVKEQIKQPRKVYCVDTGLISALVPKTTVDYERVMKNAVFLELKRRKKEVFYYTDPACEVDFLIKEGIKITQSIQVCRSLKDEETKKREVNALLKASQLLKCRHLLIITGDEEREEKAGGKKIEIVPLWKWLLRD